MGEEERGGQKREREGCLTRVFMGKGPCRTALSSVLGTVPWSSRPLPRQEPLPLSVQWGSAMPSPSLYLLGRQHPPPQPSERNVSGPFSLYVLLALFPHAAASPAWLTPPSAGSCPYLGRTSLPASPSDPTRASRPSPGVPPLRDTRPPTPAVRPTFEPATWSLAPNSFGSFLVGLRHVLSPEALGLSCLPSCLPSLGGGFSREGIVSCSSQLPLLSAMWAQGEHVRHPTPIPVAG